MNSHWPTDEDWKITSGDGCISRPYRFRRGLTQRSCRDYIENRIQYEGLPIYYYFGKELWKLGHEKVKDEKDSD